MFFNFSVFFSSIIFLCSLEAVVFASDWVVSLAAIIAIITLRASKKLSGGLSMAIMPLIFTLSSVALLYLVDSMVQRQYLIVLNVFVYYLAFLGIYRLRYYKHDKTALSMVASATMATAFLFYASAYGLYLNFAVPIGVFMLSYCAVTALLSYQYFSMLDGSDMRSVRMYSLVLGLSMAEIAWVINFWPFGYLTTGVVVLMFYYILWYLVRSYMVQELSQKHILVHLAFFSILIGVVLTSTRWIPVV